MAIIAITGEKGGPGKTMLATSLAASFADDGIGVLLVDADPQKHAAEWASERDKLMRGGAKVQLARVPWEKQRGNLYDVLRDSEQRYELVIVDTGGADSEELTTAAAAADIVYCPLIPTGSNLRTLATVDRVVRSVRDAGRSDLQTRVLLNQCDPPPHQADVPKALDYIATRFPDLTVLRPTIIYRRCFKACDEGRFTVIEAATRFDLRWRRATWAAAEDLTAVVAAVAADLGLDISVPAVPAVHGVPAVPRVHQTPTEGKNASHDAH